MNEEPCQLARMINSFCGKCSLHQTLDLEDLQNQEFDDEGEFEEEIKGFEEKWEKEYGAEKEEQAAGIEAEASDYEYTLFMEIQAAAQAQAQILAPAVEHVEEPNSNALAHAPISADLAEHSEEPVEEEPVEELQPPKRKAGRPPKAESSKRSKPARSSRQRLRGWAYVPENEIKPTQEEMWREIVKKSL